MEEAQIAEKIANTVAAATGDTTPASAPAEVTAAAPAQEKAPEQDLTYTANEQTGAVSDAQKAAYVASLKYKFLDQEKEFNPVFKELVKNGDIEKALKELHEKSDGLDFIKPKYHETRERLKTVETDFGSFKKEVEQLGSMIKNDDLDNFFSSIQMPQQKVFNWVLKKIQEQEMLQTMPPQQRMAYENGLQSKQKATQLEGTLSETQQRIEQAEAKALSFELDLTLNKPDIQSFAQSYDAQAGTPGAFKNEVIQAGSLAYHTTKKTISVEQAVKEVMSKYGKFIQSQTGQAQLQNSAPGIQQAPAQKVVIPTIQGKSSSPVQKSVRSLSDIREIRKQKYGE